MSSNKEKRRLAQCVAMKGMCWAVIKEAESRARETKDAEVREFLYAFYKLADGLVECIDANVPFTIFLSTQLELPDFRLTDEAYGKIE